MADEILEVPGDLTLVSDAELGSYIERAQDEFDRLQGEPEVSPASLDRMMKLADDLDRLRSEHSAREVRAADAAKRETLSREQQKVALATRVNGTPGSGGGGGTATAVAELPRDTLDGIAAAAARGAAAALVAAADQRLGRQGTYAGLSERAEGLAAARQHAPALPIPRPTAVITAGVDIPGVSRGAELTTIEHVVDAFHRRARSMPVTRGAPSEQLVATIRKTYEHTVDERTSPGAIEELVKSLTTPEKQKALVAGGGWCAPSEIRYDFFNIAEVDGLIDLPTFGVTRGGIRFPTSPSLADASPGFGGFANTFGNTTNPWLWTEQDDAATVTGSTNKPCIRVPCTTFNERRLECYGVCLTAGNLTDDAYPEQTQNFLRLLVAAHDHAMNQRIISTMVSLSGVAISGGGYAEANDTVTQVLNGLALAATDYRAKYGMSNNAVIEVVAPAWLTAVMTASFLWRSSEWETTSVTPAQINQFFSDRNIRVQWVRDFQERGASQFGNTSAAVTAWPTSAQVLVYAAGTFLRGDGLSLDLGVIRDSVLNAENDFTAAWSEECHLVAMVGHESRLYTIAFSVSALLPNASTSAPNL
jgi:hypothetical protein